MWKQILHTLAVIFCLSSCQSLKNLAAKDVSTTAQSITTKTYRKNPVFLDNISATPGTVVTSHHTSSTTKQGAGVKQESIVPKNVKQNTTPTDTTLTTGNIERASWLQLKYAIALNATVEQLTNITFLEKVEEWWGTKYCLGGSTKNCIDCSAFTQTVMKEVFATELPRTAQEQYKATERISPENLKEGDLVFFHTSGRKRISHVGVYIMNNKFIHSGTSTGVTISDLGDTYWKQHYRAAGRMTGSTNSKKDEEDEETK